MPKLKNAFYEIPPKGSMKFEDGEIITYTCENIIYRFPQDEEIVPKKYWIDTLDVKCGWENQWEPSEVLRAVCYI